MDSTSAARSKATRPGSRAVLSSAANALRALECLVDRGDVGVSEMARHLGVTVGTGHRVLVTLVEMGFAEQNPESRRYRPSSKILSLAQQMRGRVSARDRVHLHLVELVQVVRESVHLAVLDEGVVLYLDKVTSDQPFGIEFRVGSRVPAHSTALGKVLLAFDEDVDIDAVIKASELLGMTDSRIDRSSLLRALRTVRTNGVAEDRGEFLADVRAVSAPIRGRHGRVVAAIDVAAPRSRFDPVREQLRAEVQRSAERISEELRQLGVDDLSP
jgi:DNA-binding IclR family transcriptional regulator